MLAIVTALIPDFLVKIIEDILDHRKYHTDENLSANNYVNKSSSPSKIIVGHRSNKIGHEIPLRDIKDENKNDPY